ncbi:PQQ-dependent sugar dehydrogenase [Xinfangfangia sp. CPCC 101601]|uniref:PQQ-dependent sugar dehydrogenase n=1 Tax=Pseudogemmobacter lacusdianii TaxID=3069608 RepID=A0ABU0VVB6_9RHOB|nr:PQQ-dependent sugar dehydrogenase [Xinfangfangia sp. CPCC 101601]MDQ2065628.1 PQQ-dependent sugar dehydrogenase [Xinfangfangia sp. CPCC 101601]
MTNPPAILRAIAMASPLLAIALSAQAGTVETSAGPMQITTMTTGLQEPWGLAFLPDGRFLVTERSGKLWLVNGAARHEVTGLPDIVAEGQGGLLDVMIPADFATTREVWLSFTAKAQGGLATAAGKGRLSADGKSLVRFETVFLGSGAPGGRHFGARLVEARDGTILLATGDRGTGPEGQEAQDPATSIGKVIRFGKVGQAWKAEVFSSGHRNIQGAALDGDGRFFTTEHGAQGGDELNAPLPGRNYGWPVISYGVNYGGGAIGDGTAREGMEQPLHYWDPSIAPSGLMIYSGALVPDWQGDFFFGSLNSDFLGRLDPQTPAPTGYAEERIAAPETGRVRDVKEGPDGAIWFLSVTDGAVYRLAP